MSKEEIKSLFKKYNVRIPKEKQGQSECYKCKENHKYSLTWTSFLYEYEEHYYCYEHILNILLYQENQELKKQLEEKENIACNWKDSCLENAGKIEKLENQQKEFISYLEDKIYSIEPKGTGINYNCEYDSEEDYISAMKEQSELNAFKEILSKYKK